MNKRKKIFQNVLCIVLACAMLVTSMGASNPIEVDVIPEYDPNNYYHYTVEFEDIPQMFSMENNNVEKIDTAVSYVESLELGKMGYSYIEEACLSELEDFKDIDYNLESYTVLVPRNSGLMYYGMRGGIEYRYANTSTHIGNIPSYSGQAHSRDSSAWLNFATGVGGLAVSIFGGTAISVLFSSITAVLPMINSGQDILVGDYFEYLQRYDNVVSTTIYREMSPENFAPGYQFQTGDVQIELYFCTNRHEISPGQTYIRTLCDETKSTEPSSRATAMSECDRGIYNAYTIIKQNLTTLVDITEYWE